MRNYFIAIFSLVFVAGCGAPAQPKLETPVPENTTPELSVSYNYPDTKRDDVQDNLHGVEISDPYRWLEDDENADVKEWQKAQTTLAREYLDTIPGREGVRDRIAELFRVDVESPPVHKGAYYFQKKRKADQDQPVLYVSKGFPGEQKELVNPNTAGEDDNTVALDWWYPSSDGELLAYGLSSSGSERSTLYILETATSKKLPDEIPNTRSARVAWLPDKSGFYYSGRPDPESKQTWFNRVFFHKLGTDAKKDTLIYGDKSTDEDIHEPFLSPDGKHLVVAVYKGAGGAVADLFYKSTKNKNSGFKPVTANKNAAFWADLKNDKMVVLTNYKAPKYRVIEIDYKNLEEKHWKEIIAEGDDPIDQILVIKDHLVVKTMHHAAIELHLHEQSGKRIKKVELPTLGRAFNLSGEFDDEEFFYGFTSFIYAGDIYRYSLKNGQSSLVSRINVPVDPEKYQVEQVFYESKDGTKIPMFIAKLKGLDTSKPRAAMITAYGGFNIALTPYFLGKFMPFIEAGGIFAMPNLRGGSEYGEQWHQDGMLAKKQNTFDDMIAAAEYMIKKGLTTPEQLGIRGGSNGGLLVGAVMVQRPDLIGSVICAVPLLDMVRYHKFLIAKLWIPEYGSADDPEQFKYIYDYSPYHHVKEGSKYPATLLLTAESDSRVAPLHARKFAAMVQSKNGGNNPILLHVEEKAGHGQGKPISMRIEDATDIIAFLMHRTGLLK